ncbi:MAG: hypothetical protein ABJH98_07860 [Reichenbachiella sp.]|uniref:hypothetical protein n=1 Tax=Reichenbachiella sp. TaxID=2184521 RepID=UPI00329721C8
MDAYNKALGSMCFRVKILRVENPVPACRQGRFENILGNCSNTSKYKKRFDSKSYAYGHGQSRCNLERALGKLLIGAGTA